MRAASLLARGQRSDVLRATADAATVLADAAQDSVLTQPRQGDLPGH